MSLKNELQLMEGARTSLICDSVPSNFSYQHRLLSNKQEKIITVLRSELEECDEFLISVAFITEGGVALILQQLKKLQNKKIRGKIITGDYLNFTQPKALRKLFSFENIELKMVKGENLHAKGFFFRKGDIWNMIIGSSNLTQAALTTNLEWNLKISSLENGKIAKEILGSFTEIYDNLDILSEEELLDYEKLYLETKKRLNYDSFNRKIEYSKIPLPNLMQREALLSLKKLREENHEKALLISATGTGKTYLSAFDVAEYKPKKMLFIAHRKNILTKSKKSFKNLIPDRSMEIFDPEKSGEGDFVFAMIQTLNRDEHLKKFPQDYFDYIIVDEVHHSGAATYQKVIQYFKPKFLLGMTATPERSDDFDIYRLFNNTIAYEIRLHDALREKLLCPFHYFGVRDITQNGESISQKSSIKDLTSEVRIKNILEQTRYYGYSGPKLHGLIFVSNVDEARELSALLNEEGLLTKALTGEDSEAVRERAIDDLTDGKLQYLITVDIFNEGIDIPCVNQVVLLRPTESAIVYVQQLGRGLRKDHKKEFVVILDFIGNYEKNFLIPTAISQNNSYDKDFMKRFISRGTDLIPGESSVVFEEIVKEEIFKNINKTNFSTKKNIEHDYKLLKKQLGRTPYLFDFFRRNMIDPSVILKYRKDYSEILETIDKNSITEEHKLNKEEKNYLKYLSQFFTPAKRIHDMVILKELFSQGRVKISDINRKIEEELNIKNQMVNTENAVKHLTKGIYRSFSVNKEYLPLGELKDNRLSISESLMASYKNNSYFNSLVNDLIIYNMEYCKKNFFQKGEKTIIPYKYYTKEEAHRYLNLDYNNGFQVGGYNFFKESKEVTIFITLDATSSFTSYDNQFLDQKNITWFSKNNRVLKRNGVNTGEGDIADNLYTLHIFLKKTNSENFYYLGRVEKVVRAEMIKNSKEENLVKYTLELQHEVEEGLYDYLVAKEGE